MIQPRNTPACVVMHPALNSNRRVRAAAALGVLGVIAGTAAIATAAHPPAFHAQEAARSRATVTIKGIDFHPRSVTIRRGGSVTWRFADPEVSHNVTSHGKPRFRSSPTKLTGRYTVTFRRAGTYRYVCTIHPNMHGRVLVR